MRPNWTSCAIYGETTVIGHDAISDPEADASSSHDGMPWAGTLRVIRAYREQRGDPLANSDLDKQVSVSYNGGFMHYKVRSIG